MEEERDIVVFADDEGNEFELDVIDYFEYEGQEYAILMDLSDLPDPAPEQEEECECTEQDVFIMKVVTDGEMEEFLSLIHISEPTRLLSISYAVFCLKKKK